MARRFTDTYMQNPPGDIPHEITVVINGGDTTAHDWVRPLFNPLPVNFLQHNNYGKDIGAYQFAADQLDCDLMICLGAPVHFHKAGWLDRIAMAYYENGPAVYGPWGFGVPRPHLRTTAFWLPPVFLNSYPKRVGDGDRYGFEHGSDSITLWSKKLGFDPLMVTWDGCYKMDEWHHITTEQSLFIDQHMDRNQVIEKANRPQTARRR
jgi:hypothetical protein